jgi:hypothetical protein
MELFSHLANGTFLVSFLVRDILKLRVLSVVGGFFLLAYFPLTTPVRRGLAQRSVAALQLTLQPEGGASGRRANPLNCGATHRTMRPW